MFHAGFTACHRPDALALTRCCASATKRSMSAHARQHSLARRLHLQPTKRTGAQDGLHHGPHALAHRLQHGRQLVADGQLQRAPVRARVERHRAAVRQPALADPVDLWCAQHMHATSAPCGGARRAARARLLVGDWREVPRQPSKLQRLPELHRGQRPARHARVVGLHLHERDAGLGACGRVSTHETWRAARLQLCGARTVTDVIHGIQSGISALFCHISQASASGTPGASTRALRGTGRARVSRQRGPPSRLARAPARLRSAALCRRSVAHARVVEPDGGGARSVGHAPRRRLRRAQLMRCSGAARRGARAAPRLRPTRGGAGHGRRGRERERHGAQRRT